MQTLRSNIAALIRAPYFPMLDSVRVYRKFGLSRAAQWFFIRLLVPFGISQKRRPARIEPLATLCATGFAELPKRSAAEVAVLIDCFLRGKAREDQREYASLGAYFDYWRSRSVLRPTGYKASGRPDCPVSAISRDPAIVALVTEYLGIPIDEIRVTATIDALIRLEAGKKLIDGYDGAVEFHRDIDSWKWVKVFIYLTPTADGDGHHEIFARSHLRTPLSLVPIRRYGALEVSTAMPEASLTKICGEAGFAFIENTFAFHRGTEPTHRDRLILIVTYYDRSVASWMYLDDTYPLE